MTSRRIVQTIQSALGKLGFRKSRTSIHSGYTATGKGVGISITGVLDGPCRSLIEIGDHVTIAGSTILTHDAMGNNHDGIVKVGKIILEDHVSIGWGSIILPGVRLGRGCIIAAGSVVTSGTDVPPGEMWGGNPAYFIGTVTNYLDHRMTQRSRSAARAEELRLVKRPGASYFQHQLKGLNPLEIIYLDDTSAYSVPRDFFERGGRG